MIIIFIYTDDITLRMGVGISKITKPYLGSDNCFPAMIWLCFMVKKCLRLFVMNNLKLCGTPNGQ
jgi:predicted metal-binding transcription factor (methanogenesis marker protein 9)